MTYALVSHGMKPIFCFVLKPGSRMKSAIVYSYSADNEQREIFHLDIKWADAAGGIGAPVASIEDAVGYVRSVEKKDG